MNDNFQILKDMCKSFEKEDMSLEEYAIKLANDYSKVCKSNHKLQQENQRLKEKIDKATDMLSKQLAFTSSYLLNYQNAMLLINETLEILKGEINE